MKWHDHCQYMEIARDYSVSDLARFHGHLGPFIVLGYRMGRHALEHLGVDPFSMKAQVYCSGITPQSCLADGVQLGSGCTLGKGNIEIIRSDVISCIFSSGEKRVRLTPLPLKTLDSSDPDYELTIERYAESLYTLPNEELFRVEGL
ncbi:MAG: formylmethanofuran dehydrogenase [Methanomicrobiales archaeon HGW-Methanomicrobiales-4]|nr:MAG: formylmethanofuran dehydrogenase [Methanomicrobiales archaeon HGW-Methanomicrobiales-4]